MDIAPFFWYYLTDVENIYAAENMSWSEREKAPIGYAQSQAGLAVSGQFENGFPDDDLWAAQATYQHQSTTDKELVKRLIRAILNTI
ncbi:MAG: hypothetical protein IPN42_14845 [Methylococcaceae bacterium]|nr:hypothetical protein [Methylococcaceae bacterium]